MGILNDKMTALANAVREKQFIQAGFKISLDDMVAIIRTMPGYGSVESAETLAADVSAGKVFYTYPGITWVGTMPDTSLVIDGNSVTVPAGRVREDIAVKSGSVVLDGNMITVEEGYVSADELTVPEGTLSQTDTGNTLVVGEGYYKEQTVTVGNAVEGYTITPGTREQIIPAGSYLSGNIAVAGDSELVPENIVSGKSIFGVAGTASAGGTPGGSVGSSADFYKCSSVDEENKTWSGYLAVLVDGMYTYEDVLTTGLSYGAFYTPEIGGVYSADCSIKAGTLYGPEKLLFGATANNSGTGIAASFTTFGREARAYEPYRDDITHDQNYVFTGPTENKTSWSRVVVWDAEYSISPYTVTAYVHNYTSLDDDLTVTAVRVEGSNDFETWDVLGSLEGVNATGIWSIPCSSHDLYKSLRIVFTSAQDGRGAVLWKVDIEGFYKYAGTPDATPYNPKSVESDDYSITCSYSWWDDERPWKAFNFGEDAAFWGSDTSNTGVGQWLAWENKKKAVCIKRYQLWTGDEINDAEGFELQGYNESSGEWETIDSRVTAGADGVKLYGCPSNTSAYKKHRFLCTSMGGGHHFQLTRIAAWTS